MDEATTHGQVDKAVLTAGAVLEDGLRRAVDFDAALAALYAQARQDSDSPDVTLLFLPPPPAHARNRGRTRSPSRPILIRAAARTRLVEPAAATARSLAEVVAVVLRQMLRRRYPNHPSASNGWRGSGLAPMILSFSAVVALLISGAMLGASIERIASQPASIDRVGGPPAGDPPPPPSGSSDRPTGRPEIVVNQPMGDANTVFVVHGRGWTPGSQVTIALVGGRQSPRMPVVDMKGTFNYAINQEREFFSGPIPPGNHTVVAAGSGGVKREVSFFVGRP
jgi:hypothetical protein